jgi:hypothetical protein
VSAGIDWSRVHVDKLSGSELRRLLYAIESAAIADNASDLDCVYMRKIRAELERRRA